MATFLFDGWTQLFIKVGYILSKCVKYVFSYRLKNNNQKIEGRIHTRKYDQTEQPSNTILPRESQLEWLKCYEEGWGRMLKSREAVKERLLS